MLNIDTLYDLAREYAADLGYYGNLCEIVAGGSVCDSYEDASEHMANLIAEALRWEYDMLNCNLESWDRYSTISVS